MTDSRRWFLAAACLLSVCLAPAGSFADAQTGINAEAEALDVALWSAAADGNLELFDQLLARGAQAQQSGTATSALWIASQEGHVQIVRRLLALGADVEAADPTDGRTALFQAAQEGHAAIVQLLLESGARVEVASIRTGATPLFTAAARGHTEVVRLLLAAHADVDVLASANGIVDCPLSIASKRGYADIVEMIEQFISNSMKL